MSVVSLGANPLAAPAKMARLRRDGAGQVAPDLAAAPAALIGPLLGDLGRSRAGRSWREPRHHAP